MARINSITERVDRTHQRIDNVLEEQRRQLEDTAARIRQTDPPSESRLRVDNLPASAPPPLRRTNPPLPHNDVALQPSAPSRQAASAEHWAPTPPNEDPTHASGQGDNQVRALMDVYGGFSRDVRARYLPGEDALSEQSRLRLPTPPSTDEAASQTSRRDHGRSLTGSRSLTPRFAPAFRQQDPVPEPVRPAPRDRSRSPLRPSTSRGENDRARERERLPPLRRMARNSVHRLSDEARADWAATVPSIAQLADGLGDRRRSYSPETSWDTLHRTITPDFSQPTSASTSFTSAPAAQLAAILHRATNAVRPVEPERDAEEMYGFTWTSESGGESAPPASDTGGPAREASVTSMDESDSASEPDSAGRTPVSAQDTQLPGDSIRTLMESNIDFGRSGPTSERRSQAPPPPDVEREHLRTVINHLAQRPDIPLSWWETAGLGRLGSSSTPTTEGSISEDELRALRRAMQHELEGAEAEMERLRAESDMLRRREQDLQTLLNR